MTNNSSISTKRTTTSHLKSFNMKKITEYGDGNSVPALAQVKHKHIRPPRLYDCFLSCIKHVKITICDFNYLYNLCMIYIVYSTTCSYTRYNLELKFLQCKSKYSKEHGNWIYNYMSNQCLSSLKLCVQTSFIPRNEGNMSERVT